VLLNNDHPRTRTTDPLTSHQAADSNNISGSRAVVLDLLRMVGPQADHEMVDRHEWSRVHPQYTAQRLRTARAELVEAGLVEFAGEYHLTPTGRRTQMWRAVDVSLPVPLW